MKEKLKAGMSIDRSVQATASCVNTIKAPCSVQIDLEFRKKPTRGGEGERGGKKKEADTANPRIIRGVYSSLRANGN